MTKWREVATAAEYNAYAADYAMRYGVTVRSGVAAIAEPPVFYWETTGGVIIAKAFDDYLGKGATYMVLDES